MGKRGYFPFHLKLKYSKRWRIFSTALIIVFLVMCLLRNQINSGDLYYTVESEQYNYITADEVLDDAAQNWRGLQQRDIQNMSALGRRLFLGDMSSVPLYDRNFTILVWKHGPNIEKRFVMRFGSRRWDPFQDCSVSNCRLTYNSCELNTADAVLFHLHRTPNRQFLPDPETPRPAHQRWVFLTDENPFHTFTLGSATTEMKDYNGIFNWSMTYRMDSDVPVPSGRALPLTKAEKLLQREQRRNGKIEEKSKLAAIMMSNCGGKNKRWEYLQLLRKHMPVDVYGACGNLSCTPRFIPQCAAKILKKAMTTVDDIALNEVFRGQEDRYHGITVDSSKESCDISVFPKKLEASLKQWTEKSFRGIWFKVTLEHADWVPILAKNEFQFHHAKPGYVMMYRWLPATEVCNIPPFAHTMIGVGAVVMNKAHEILVVREKHFVIPHWKLPGGYVEPGEDIGDAAIREVFEETNIKSEFQFLISLRHTHHGMFKCSDIYFVVGLKPLSEEIVKCSREIAGCEWMKVEEFLHHPEVHETNRYFVRKYLEYLENRVTVECTKDIHPLLKKPQCVYSIDFNPSEELLQRKAHENSCCTI